METKTCTRCELKLQGFKTNIPKHKAFYFDEKNHPVCLSCKIKGETKGERFSRLTQ